MATDPQSLATAGNCYECLGMLSQYEIFKIVMLAQISTALNASNDVTPQGLLNQATCFECYGFMTIAQLLELALLAQIAAG